MTRSNHVRATVIEDRTSVQACRAPDAAVSTAASLAAPSLPANAVHSMQLDALVRLNSEEEAPLSQPRGARLAAAIAVPAVVVGAACLVPLAVAGLGLSRIARGRVHGLGRDSVEVARATWRAGSAAVAVLSNRETRRD